jgi:hypothetical protein
MILVKYIFYSYKYISDALGGSCSADGDCTSDSNQQCNNLHYGICVCKRGFTDISGTCKETGMFSLIHVLRTDL